MKIVGAEGMSADQLKFEIQREAGGLSILHFDSCNNLSPRVGCLFHTGRRERNLQRIALGSAYGDCGLVGHSLGTDFFDTVVDNEFPGRKRYYGPVQRWLVPSERTPSCYCQGLIGTKP